MNHIITIFTIASVLGIGKCQETSGTVIKEKDSMDCYYCGIKDNCELPFDKDDGKIIKCDKSCVKFDGFAKDGKRIVVRNCGYFTADECIDGIYYEDEDTIGTTCHCLQDKCNSAISSNVSWLLIIMTKVISVKL